MALGISLGVAPSAFATTPTYDSTTTLQGSVIGLTIDHSGNWWAAGSKPGNSFVQEYSSTGAPIQTIGAAAPGGLDFVTSVAIEPSGNIIVSDTNHGRLVEFDSTGHYLRTISSNAPEDVVVDGAGNIYAAEYWGYDVREWHSSGAFVRSFGLGSNGIGVAVDGSGNVYATSLDATVRKFSNDGTLLATQAGVGRTHPAIDDATDRVYLSNDITSRVQSLTTGLVPVDTFGPDGLPTPLASTALDGHGHLYVVGLNSDYTSSIAKYNLFSDTTPPTISLTQPGANAAGWFGSSAVEHVSATDASGVASIDCTVDGNAVSLSNVTSDGTHRAGDVVTSDEGRHSVSCRATDGAGNYADGTDTLRLDKTGPNAPSINADRVPDYSGGGGWYKDSVTLSFAGNGDPALADRNPGSGVDPSSVPSAVTFSTSGSHTASGAVSDYAGNSSSTASETVQVDADAPTLSASCPATAYLNGSASATFSASDGQSGLASDPSGQVPIDTSSVGAKTLTRTATDNVGRSTTKSCTTNVIYKFGGFQQPINADGSSIFKLGSTIPVKIILTDANGTPVSGAAATLQFAQTSGSVLGGYTEAVSTASASTGSAFRYDSTSQQYVFNLGTKSMSTGSWSLRASLDDGTTYSISVSLK